MPPAAGTSLAPAAHAPCATVIDAVSAASHITRITLIPKGSSHARSVRLRMSARPARSSSRPRSRPRRAPIPEASVPPASQLVEATIPDMLKAIQTGLLTSEQLVGMYLARIDGLRLRRTGAELVSHGQRSRDRRRAGARRGAAERHRASAALRHSGRCSRTTSTPSTCRRRPDRWRSPARFRSTTPSSPRSCGPLARSSSARRR